MDCDIPYNDDERIESHLSKTQRLERTYEETIRKAELIIKDEAARRLKVRILALEHDNNDLHEQLAQEEDRIDELEQAGEEVRAQLEEAQENACRFEAEMKTQAREISNLKVELSAMNGVTTDSTKLLTEKLALARELATLKPELEYLRSQSAYQQTVLSEKLALQRQVSTLEVELETEKRALKRATRKNNSEEKEVEINAQLEDLQKDLAREKRELEKSRKQVIVLETELEAEKRASKRAARRNNNEEREFDLQAQVEDLQKDLAREKRETEKTRKQVCALEEELDTEKCALKRATSKVHNNPREAELQHQVESLESDLTRERRDTEKARKQINDPELQLEEMEKRVTKLAAQKTSNGQKELDLQNQLEEARKASASERWEREKMRKEAEKELEFSEARKSALESKLEQMQTKLRSTKEHFKECQVELAQARAAAGKAGGTSRTLDLPVKNSRKRSAVEMSTDDAIGTPDGVAVRGKRPIARRGRIDQTMVGEKSMFSITPYLNRTVSVAPDTPAREKSDSAEENGVEHGETLLADHANDAEPGNEVATLVGDSVSTPSNPPKAKSRRKNAEKKLPVEKSALGEAKAGSTNNKKTAPKKLRTISTLEKVAEESDENEEIVVAPVADKALMKPKPDAPKTKMASQESEEMEPGRKKRKLLNGGKTLFDEDDGEATKRPAKIALGPPKLLGRGGLAGPKGSLKGGLAHAGSFGAFSPLKKDRRGTGASFLA